MWIFQEIKEPGIMSKYLVWEGLTEIGITIKGIDLVEAGGWRIKRREWKKWRADFLAIRDWPGVRSQHSAQGWPHGVTRIIINTLCSLQKFSRTGCEGKKCLHLSFLPTTPVKKWCLHRKAKILSILHFMLQQRYVLFTISIFYWPQPTELPHIFTWPDKYFSQAC